ncbi:MAG: right-handed parallel beta-helix repeat-containing protein, partial [Candidatus Aenigmatarchaeota archaeon]
DIDWVEFCYLGENATSKYGVVIETTTGSCDIRYSSFHDFEDYGIYITGTTADNITFSNNIAYALSGANGFNFYIASATSGTAITVDSNVFVYSAYGSAYGYYLLDVGITLTNNSVAGMGFRGFYFSETGGVLGTISNNIAHSCNSSGFLIANCAGGTLSDLTCWRNNSYGVYFLDMTFGGDIICSNLVAFGNTTTNIGFSRHGNVVFENAICNGDSTFATTYGLYIAGNAYNIKLINSNFSTAGGIKTAHSVADIYFAGSAYGEVTCLNTILAATTEVGNIAAAQAGSYVRSQKHDQVAGNHKSWFKFGIIQIDSTYYKTAAPSQRLTPNNATYRLESGKKRFAVGSGGTATVSVWVRKSADYNGAQPRLILKRNDAAGITADTVLDTMTAGAETWEQLSGVTPAVTDNAILEVLVDCSGTAGFINIDDWEVS